MTATLQHAVVVFAVTDTAHLYGCQCGVNGPLRPDPADAEQDGRDHLNRTQLKAAAEALGLDPSNVTHFQVDASDGVIVVSFARAANGKLRAAGNRVVELAHHIPIGDGPGGDQA